MTGAGMMDCKKALIEAEGDYERAKDIIREKGKLVVSKRADRSATEGVVVPICCAWPARRTSWHRMRSLRLRPMR